jgi:predicted ATPase
VLAAYEPALADSSSTCLKPPPLPVAAERARVLEALQATLFAFAESNPVLLVLDDLQWADELSKAFLQGLGPKSLGAHGVLVVGTWDLAEGSGAPLEGVGAPGAESLWLKGLDAAGVGELVRGMLALREPPTPLVDSLVQRSGGNPFLVAESLRAAMDEGVLHRDGTGVWRLAR